MNVSIDCLCKVVQWQTLIVISNYLHMNASVDLLLSCLYCLIIYIMLNRIVKKKEGHLKPSFIFVGQLYKPV